MAVRQLSSLGLAVLALTAMVLGGCSPYRGTIAASCVRPAYNDNPRGNKEPVNFVQLRQDPPPQYLLGPGDILGVFIEGVLGKFDEAPPVQLSTQPNTPPAIGYPVVIDEDGTVSLPLIPPLRVAQLTLPEALQIVRKAYVVDYQVLRSERRILLSLMKPRTYSVLVVREDATATRSNTNRNTPGYEPERQAMTRVVELKAYENDVLHALSESGGLPGLDAKNEITILRGAMRGPGTTALPQGSGLQNELLRNKPNGLRIPLRIGPNDPPVMLAPSDIILNNGDVLFVESRRSEVFYTGGLLVGGQHHLPRDYDLDVLGAIAMAGGSISAAAGSTNNGNGNRGAAIGTIFPPTRVIVIRTVNGQVHAVKVNVKTAITDPRERILIQPNDMILLEYTEWELCMNVLLNNVNLNLSLNELFRR